VIIDASYTQYAKGRDNDKSHLMYQLPRSITTHGRLETKNFTALKDVLLPFIRRVSMVAETPHLQETLTKKKVFVFKVTKKDTWLEIVLMARKMLSNNLQRKTRSLLTSPTFRQWASVRTCSSFGGCF
jgi:hypothetical protein